MSAVPIFESRLSNQVEANFATCVFNQTFKKEKNSVMHQVHQANELGWAILIFPKVDKNHF